MRRLIIKPKIIHQEALMTTRVRSSWHFSADTSEEMGRWYGHACRNRPRRIKLRMAAR